MLEIQSNGSKWYGQEPDSIEELIQVLNKYSLDPTFEDYGNFIQLNPKWLKPEIAEKYQGCAKFFGNFSSISHVFNIITDEPEIIQVLTNAINKNIQTKEYQVLRSEYIEDEQRKTKARTLFNQGKINQRQMYQMITGELEAV